jgi:hypothetical protein
MNDGECDLHGRFWAGSIGNGKQFVRGLASPLPRRGRAGDVGGAADELPGRRQGTRRSA